MRRGQHIRREGVELTFDRLEDDYEFHFLTGIPSGAKSAFVVEAKGHRVFELEDGKAFGLDGLGDARIAKQTIGIGNDSDPRHLWHKSFFDVVAPIGHGSADPQEQQRCQLGHQEAAALQFLD